MAAGEIHVGDVGTVFEVTVKDETGVPVDLSTATKLQMIFNTSGRAPLVVTPTFSTDGTDGQLFYITVASDLSASGAWSMEVYYELAGGEKKHTDTDTFQVFPNLATA